MRVKRLVKWKVPNVAAGAGFAACAAPLVGMRVLGRFANVWFSLQPRQRLIGVLALMALIAAVIGLAQSARTPSMATLYSGLEPAAAGEVAAAVEAMGVAVQAQGSTVLVPASERDRVRMALAAEGLPRNGPAGYEILDGMDGFGTSSEMFEATYWRAKEGELARTLLASPGVRTARVHIANTVGRPFQRGAQPSASVTVQMSYGALSASQAEAMRYLVASAVAGLSPERVSVIDAAHGAVLRMGESGGDADAQLPGSAREAALRAEVERLLAARVGDGRAIVTVSVDTVLESQTIVERSVDPQSRVVISSDTREVTETSSGNGGAATVASNLPQGQAAGGESQAQRAETEERVNYEVSETRRETIRRAGDVRRLTVAVLVDGVSAPGDDGEPVWTPRPQAELDQLRELVRAAVGFNAERGDVVTVETLQFAARAAEGTVAHAGVTEFLSRNAMSLIQTGLLAIVALGLAFFVLRPLMKAAGEQADMPERLPPSLDFREADEFNVGEPVDRLSLLRMAFQEQKEDSANVLRSWLERDVQDNVDDEREKEPT